MMARIRKAMEEKDQGFTLIELLVVMIIIGILAAIAVPVFLNQRTKAVDSSIKSDLKNVASNIESASVDTMTYPAAVTASSGAASDNTISVNSQTIALSSGNVITYSVNSDKTVFCLSGANAKSNAKGGVGYFYKSDKGGLLATLQTAPTGCPAIP